MKNNWNVSKYLVTTIDPLHIGTGGQRLGRVDATIVRDPVSNVPKIPGTSLSGALKFFFDLALRNEGKNNICASTAGSDNERNNHSRSECPVCAAFGYTTDKKSMQGILQFSDAELLAYPVNSAAGPIWITTPGRLSSLCGLGSGEDHLGDHFAPVIPGSKVLKGRPTLNFGWILLEAADHAEQFSADDLGKCAVSSAYAERMVMVSEFVFSNLVNSNMEVRTSVVIDPETGAAAGKGLFTYEAVVKGAIFVCSITENDYAGIWENVQWQEKFPSALKMLEAKAFGGVKAVGIGGMTTRGFGRLDIRNMGE